MAKSYAKDKVWVTLTQWDKNSKRSQTSRRSGTKIAYIIADSQAEKFRIKVIYFGNKEMTNESLVGNKTYARMILKAFTEKSLIKSLE